MTALTFSTDGSDTFTVHRDGWESVDFTPDEVARLARAMPVWLEEIGYPHELTQTCWCHPHVEVVGAPDTETSRLPEDFFTEAGASAIESAYVRGWNDAMRQENPPDSGETP